MRARLHTFLGLLRRPAMLVVVLILTVLVLWFRGETQTDTALYEMNTRLSRIEFQLGIAETPHDSRKGSVPCTERIQTEDPQRFARVQEEVRNITLAKEKDTQRELAVLQDLLQAKGISPAPAELALLSRDSFEILQLQGTYAIEEKDGHCSVHFSWKDELVRHRVPFPGAWNQVVALALYGFQHPDSRTEEWGPESELETFLQDRWLAFGGQAWAKNAPVHRVRREVLKAVEDEVALAKLAPWVLRVVPPLLVGEWRGKAQRWLATLWQASRGNLRNLSRLVDENKIEFTSQNSEVQYQGRFMRRWRSIRAREGEKKADAMIVVYRFWFAKAAQALGHPQAAAWRQEVAREFGTPRGLAYETWYKSQL